MVLFGSCLGFLSNKPAAAAAAAVVTIEPTPMQLKLMKALEKKKEHFARKFEQELSFTRVLLKLGTVKTFMHDVRKVFEDRDTDKSGHIDMSEMSAAMKALNVKLTEDEVKSLFEMADFYEDNQLTLKQFLVVLAMGYVLDAIPDLIEGGADAQADAPARTAGRRRSTFYDKERIVRETLELFTYAYLLFDKECKGVISREQVMFVVAENGQQDTGSMNILSQERWEEMDWDSNGDISFGEFVYAFTKWVDFEGGDEDTEEHKEPKPPADTSRLGGLGRRLSSITAVPAAFADPGRQGGQGRRKSSVTALPPESIELARTGGQGRRRSSVTVAPPPPTGSVDLARQGGQGRRKSSVTAVAAPRRSSVSVKDIGRRLSSAIARGPTEKDVSSRRLTGSYRVVAEGSASPLADQALTAQNTPEGNAGAAPFPSSSGTTDVADKAEQGQKQEQHQEKGKEKGQKQEIGQSAQEQGSIAPAVLADGGADAG